MHKKGALKYDRWGIEVYNRRIGIKDTQEIGNNKSDLIEKKYPHLGIRLETQERIKIAVLLSPDKLSVLVTSNETHILKKSEELIPFMMKIKNE